MRRRDGSEGIVRLAHVSDNHFAEDLRLDDCVEVHRVFAEQAQAAGVDAVLFGGDFFERRSTPRERNALAAHLADLRRRDIMAFGVSGNHDAPGDLALFNYVLGPSGGRIADRRLDADALGGGLVLGEIDIDDECKGFPSVAVIGLPWIERSWYVAHQKTPEDALRAVGELARAASANRRIPILVAHLEVEGYETSPGHSPAGSTMAVPQSTFTGPGGLTELFAYVALGHIHRAQAWCSGQIRYSGSPQRNNFGEPEAKGWVYVEIDLRAAYDGPAGLAIKHAEFRELPARRISLRDYSAGDMVGDDRLWRTEPEQIAEQLTRDGGDMAGELVRLRIRCRPEETSRFDLARIEAMLREYGAAEAKVELQVEREDRVRSEAITTAVTSWDKFLAYCEANSCMPDDETLGRLREKLDSIELEGLTAP